MMGYVLLALLPVTAGAILYFGWKALLIIAISIISCILFEFLYNVLAKRPQTIHDCSAAVTGLIFAMNMPVSVPLWLLPIGCLFAIVVVKMLFGGLGKNIFNPALAGRIFLFLTFAQYMSGNWIAPFDGVSSATPLEYLKNNSGQLVTITDKISVTDCILGNIGGCLGETSAILILVGGLFLLYKRVITWHIPVSFIGTVALITILFPRYNDISAWQFMLYQISSGGLFFGAFFMATDYSTSPITPLGRIIYGVGCGLITVFIRYFGSYPEGVSFAILLMNCFAGYLDTKTIPNSFGGERRVFGKKAKQD
jgi:electron transport complex protein RnfD